MLVVLEKRRAVHRANRVFGSMDYILRHHLNGINILILKDILELHYGDETLSSSCR